MTRSRRWSRASSRSPRVAIVLGKALFYRQLEQGLVVARNQHDEVVGVSLHIIWKAA